MSKSSIFIIILVVILIGIVGFYFYNSGKSIPAGSALLKTPKTTNIVGAEDLALLRQVQSIKIDTAFFSTPAFQSLNDFTVNIPRANVSNRSNPFDPLPNVPNPFIRR